MSFNVISCKWYTARIAQVAASLLSLASLVPDLLTSSINNHVVSKSFNSPAWFLQVVFNNLISSCSHRPGNNVMSTGCSNLTN